MLKFDRKSQVILCNDSNILKNDKCLAELVFGFFDYFSKFEWSTHKISVNEQNIEKREKDHNLWWISHPLNVKRNIAKASNFEVEQHTKEETSQLKWKRETKSMRQLHFQIFNGICVRNCDMTIETCGV